MDKTLRALFVPVPRLRLTLLGLFLFAVIIHAAEPTVTEVTAKQRYPWNGLVDITCKVQGINGTTNGLKFAVSALIPNSGEVRKVSQLWLMQGGTKLNDRKVHTNGVYRLLWDAQADLGQVLYSNMVMRVTVVELRPKVQLWEGGPYWAETNIGAEEPWEYGYYFWWGDTVGYRRENNKWAATDGSSSNFSFSESNTPTCRKSISTLKSEGWITADNVLTAEHDAAQVQWGGGWRMPTKQELNDLVSKCDWIWTTMNGVNGYVVSGRGDYASSSIFLPAAGPGRGTSLLDSGSRGVYWSSVPYSDYDFAFALDFTSGYHDTEDDRRFYGQSVRPVQGFAK